MTLAGEVVRKVNSRRPLPVSSNPINGAPVLKTSFSSKASSPWWASKSGPTLNFPVDCHIDVVSPRYLNRLPPKLLTMAVFLLPFVFAKGGAGLFCYR